MACLHDAQQADEQRRGTIDGNGDPALPHGARLQQGAGEHGRLLVELGVGQRSRAVAARHTRGCPGGLGGEQVVDAALARIGRVGVVDGVEHETCLLGRQEFQRPKRRFGCGDDAFQRQPVVLHPAGDRRLVEQGRAVVAIDPQARRGLDDVDAKIEGDRGLGVGRDLDREIAEAGRRRQALEVELDLGERQAIGDALQRQSAHQRAVGAPGVVEAVGQAARRRPHGR